VNVLLLALACGPKSPPASAAPMADGATWIEVETGKNVCFSGFPSVAHADRQGAAAWKDVIDALQRGDREAAVAAAEPIDPDHPAAESLGAVLSLIEGDPAAGVDTLRRIADSPVANPCIQATAALALWSQSDIVGGSELLLAARAAAPEDGQIAFLAWYLGAEEGPKLVKALKAGNAALPEHPGIALALGTVQLERGDPEVAIPLLQRAADGGMREAFGVLLHATFAAGARDVYLRTASTLGLPLSDQGQLADADDPQTRLAELLGQKPGEQLQAQIVTTFGTLTCALFLDEAPVTVANFVGLARGSQPWIDPTGTRRTDPLYNGTTFHRVLPGFMIQGGDPNGDGLGEPGYTFPDELRNTRKFDGPGVLAMANRGPHSNGSQFFVTDGIAPHLNGMHTIFGSCDEASQALVSEIAVAEEEATIERVEISSVPLPD